MKQVQSFLKNITQEKYLPLWLFAIVMLLYHMFMREGEHADAVWFFSHQLDAYSLKDYSIIRYHSWSSRLLIEGVLVYISRHFLLWRILDYLCWVFLAWSFTWLFPEEKRRVACAMCTGVLLIYPICDLQTAGWVATSVNYTWPLAFGIFSLHGVAAVVYGKKPGVWLKVFYVCAAIFSANMEQMCAILLAVNGAAILYFLYKKIKWQEYAHVILCFLVSLGEILFIFTCPGNELRKNQEIARWMPEFITFNIVDKLNIGFMETMKHFVASDNFLFLLFGAVLAVLVFLKSDKLLHRFLSLIPVVVPVMFLFFTDAMQKYLPSVWETFEENAYVNGSNYHMGKSYVFLFLYIFIIGCFAVSFAVVCDNFIELFSQLFLLALSLASRVVMGFTPTIYVSKERTFLFSYILLAASGIWLVVNNIALLRSKKKIFEAMQLTGMCVVLFCVIYGLVFTGSL